MGVIIQSSRFTRERIFRYLIFKPISALISYFQRNISARNHQQSSATWKSHSSRRWFYRMRVRWRCRRPASRWKRDRISSACWLRLGDVPGHWGPMGSQMWVYYPLVMTNRASHGKIPCERKNGMAHLFRLGPSKNHGELLVITRGYMLNIKHLITHWGNFWPIPTKN